MKNRNPFGLAMLLLVLVAVGRAAEVLGGVFPEGGGEEMERGFLHGHGAGHL